MGLQSTLRTEYAKDLKIASPAEFNEAIYDGFEAAGFEFNEARTDLKTPGGRLVPFVGEIRNNQFHVMGYEDDRPSEYAFMYANFNANMAQVIANALLNGVIILSHEIEGNGTEYYLVTPGKVEEIDIVDAILALKGLTR
ncbi:hypothetical protein D3C87_1438250 [compost metagenome]